MLTPRCLVLTRYSAKESALAQKPALPTVSEEAEETNDEDDDGEEDDDTSVKDRDRAGQTELHKLAAQQGLFRSFVTY